MRNARPVSAPNIAAEGVTNPSIDDLLSKTDSKYQLVLYGAKRARQINAYYSQLGEGLLEYVGPLVETHVQEKPLSIALREINEDLLTCEHVDPAELAAEEAAAQAAAAVRSGAHAVSLAEVVGPFFITNPDEMFSLDRFHPSALGYKRTAKAMLPSVLAALGERAELPFGHLPPETLSEPS